MARIATIDKKEDLAPQDQKVYDAIVQSRGVVGGPLRAGVRRASPSCTRAGGQQLARYGELANAVFLWIEGPGAAAVTSTVTMSESMVQPYRLSSTDWVPATREMADRAVRLRADHLKRLMPCRLRPPAAAGAPGVCTQ